MRLPSLWTVGRLPLVLLSTLAACSAGLVDVPDPSTIVDPKVVQTQDGAVGLYIGSVTSFARIFAGEPKPLNPNFISRGYSYAMANGFAGDEFTHESFDGIGEVFMQRLIGAGSGNSVAQPYSDMHTARLHIDQAIGALRQYGTTTPKSYVGEMFALKGYLYLMFGEMYCSGVPFSRAVYGGDVVLGEPETTTQMFEHAIAQFDTAISVATDSARIRQLAWVGKARALVNLSRFDDAATAASVTNVPTAFTYDLTYSVQTLANYFNISTFTGGFGIGGPGSLFMGNRLGTNGLDYAAAGDPDGTAPDPRVLWEAVVLNGPFGSNGPFPIPVRYLTGDAPITLAGGIEARLIEAEALLQKHDIAGWAGVLNDLRAHASDPAIPDLSADSTTTASDALRENVMFRERAFWLYGTGHRMGDLRRLVRQYHRAQASVFPVGNMFPDENETNMFYSNNANFAPPQGELDSNPYYHGCLNRDP